MVHDFASPFIWAGAVAVIGAVTWILQAATKYGLADIVQKNVKPLHDRLTAHLDEEERIIRSIDDRLSEMERRKDRDHNRIWDAIDDLRRR